MYITISVNPQNTPAPSPLRLCLFSGLANLMPGQPVAVGHGYGKMQKNVAREEEEPWIPWGRIMRLASFHFCYGLS